ncbi:MAG TPA: Fic family protein [Bryobacteraceae bacterium]|jgi:Fic family protein|nr:Fic family protein [Bryobacteraceae bacterium]
MIVIESQEPELYASVQEQNLLRQYDLLTNCIEIGLLKGHTSFDRYVLWSLNHVAVANICQLGGRFREEPVYVGNHVPPHFKTVPDLMDRFISTIHENWFEWTPTYLAAYGLWRLLWIHPFVEGNGRTARATCYYLLCARSGFLLPGDKIVPERIRENRAPYYAALQRADEAWNEGNLDVLELEAYLAGLLTAQLTGAP